MSFGCVLGWMLVQHLQRSSAWCWPGYGFRCCDVGGIGSCAHLCTAELMRQVPGGQGDFSHSVWLGHYVVKRSSRSADEPAMHCSRSLPGGSRPATAHRIDLGVVSMVAAATDHRRRRRPARSCRSRASSASRCSSPGPHRRPLTINHVAAGRSSAPSPGLYVEAMPVEKEHRPVPQHQRLWRGSRSRVGIPVRTTTTTARQAGSSEAGWSARLRPRYISRWNWSTQ